MIRNVLLSSAALIVLSGAALAADLPSTRAPVVPPPLPVFSWTGIYAGGQIGYAFGQDTATSVVGTPYNSNSRGVLGGAHIGYNYEAGPGGLVVGVEGDVNGSSFTGTSALNSTTKSPVQGSLRARAGFAFERALIYATGGGVFAAFNDNYTSGDSPSTARVGYTVGGGIQYAITDLWSVRAEYRYNNFGATTENLPIAGTTVSHRQTENQVLVGFSYKFTSPVAPVVARY
ncbi:MAG: outer membrane protein [Beijerinckiaceae bacterium]